MENIYKVLIIGDQGVGKSSLLLRFTANEFKKEYNVTIGLEFGSKKIELEPGVTVNLQIWDTAGQEAFKSIIRSFYQNTAAILIIYNIAKRETFESLTSWVQDVRENAHEDAIIIIVGNKCDLEQLRQVGYEEGKQKMEELGADLFYETSAQSGDNINQLFHECGEKIQEKAKIKNDYKLSVALSDVNQSQEESKTNVKQLSNGNRVEQQNQNNDKSKCC